MFASWTCMNSILLHLFQCLYWTCMCISYSNDVFCSSWCTVFIRFYPFLSKTRSIFAAPWIFQKYTVLNCMGCCNLPFQPMLSALCIAALMAAFSHIYFAVVRWFKIFIKKRYTHSLAWIAHLISSDKFFFLFDVTNNVKKMPYVMTRFTVCSKHVLG